MCHRRAGRARLRLSTRRKIKNNPLQTDLFSDYKPDYYQCLECGQLVDKRQLDDVLFHETAHKPRADIQYGGSKRL